MSTKGYGFGYVLNDGFTSFLEKLAAPPWSQFDITPYDVPDRKPTLDLFGISLPLQWVLRMKWACDDMVIAEMPLTTQSANRVDKTIWDPFQRQLESEFTTIYRRGDPVHSPRVEIMRPILLKGRGTAQTQMTIEKEIDFGYAQVRKARTKPFSEYLAGMGLTPLIDKIFDATRQLDEASGYSKRQELINAALSECRSAFTFVMGNIDWQLKYVQTEERKTLLSDMRASLQALLDRYPSPSKAEKKEKKEGEGEAEGTDEEANEEQE